LRVSTTNQDAEKNKSDILHLANEKGLGKVEWIEEQASGRISWRKREILEFRAAVRHKRLYELMVRQHIFCQPDD